MVRGRVICARAQGRVAVFFFFGAVSFVLTCFLAITSSSQR
jgi:hypothetical protein